MTDVNNPLGNIFVTHRAISTIACQSALESYGIVGLAAKNFAEGVAHVLVKDPTMGVDVDFKNGKVNIELFVIVEYGVNIKSVATSVAESIKYKIEKTFGLPVNQINIHVRGLRISNPD